MTKSKMFKVKVKTDYYMAGWEDANKDFRRFKKFVELCGGYVTNEQMGGYIGDDKAALCCFDAIIEWPQETTKTNLSGLFVNAFYADKFTVEVEN